ncbi:MAG: CinA family protein [Hyphomicrobiales bacterium]|nr:CinA family protein [Hyphomicrobiales bacterium]
MIIDPELPTMAEMTVERFRAAGFRCATVESCTGGLISALITSVPGSSDIYDRGFVTYSNDAKSEMLGVDRQSLDEFGAVSMQVAIEMAIGGLNNSEANACVAVTGIAGPGGGDEQKPVGLVYIAVANDFEEGAFGEEFHFDDQGRDSIRNEAVKAALEMLIAYGIDGMEN